MANAERSGIHITGADSGWPVAAADDTAEPEPKKDGSGTDGLPSVESVVDGVVTASGEVQTVREGVDAGAGDTFTLTFDGQTTGAIAYNASAATVQTALEALSNIAPGDISVSGSAGGPYTITFLEAGAYGDTNVGQITATGTGVTVTTTTEATGS